MRYYKFTTITIITTSTLIINRGGIFNVFFFCIILYNLLTNSPSLFDKKLIFFSIIPCLLSKYSTYPSAVIYHLMVISLTELFSVLFTNRFFWGLLNALLLIILRLPGLVNCILVFVFQVAGDNTRSPL